MNGNGNGRWVSWLLSFGRFLIWLSLTLGPDLYRYIRQWALNAEKGKKMPAIILYPNVGAIEMMGDLSTALINCNVELYQNNVSLGPATVLADLTVADFGGYAAITIAALLAVYLDPAGGASAQIATIQWDASGVAPSNLVYGFWVETAGGVLVLAGSFEAAVSMANVGDSIPLDIKFNFGG